MTGINNKKNQEFSFSSDNKIKIKNILNRYPKDQKASAVMPLLDLAMRQNEGWIPLGAMKEVSIIINVPLIRVYEVASFYSMFNLEPIGKFFIQICTTTSCWLRGSDNLLKACKKKLKIGNNETTKDGFFTLKEVECLGACVNAPMVQINDNYYEDLDEKILLNLLEGLKKGKNILPGPQTTKRKGAEPVKLN